MATTTRAPKRGRSRTRETVGFIGLGIMGSAMSANLVRAGHRVVGFDVLPARRQALKRAGGEPVDDIRAVLQHARVIICSLPSADALIDVAKTLTDSPLPKRGSHRPRVIVETSTLPIAVKEQAREDRKSTRLNSSHSQQSRMPSSA